MKESDILGHVQDRLNKAGQRYSLPEWTKRNIFLDSISFSFDMHPELMALYKDTHPNIKIRKSVQIGASCYAISFILYGAIEGRLNALYCGPTDDWIKDFVPGKVDPIIRDSPKIKSKIGEVNTPFLKKIGFGTLYFRGLKTETNTASISADILIKDEKDLLHQKYAEIVEERLEHSQKQIIRELSKPSFADFGIDKDFKEGDQHYFLFKCRKCNTYNNVILNIWEDPERFLCKHTRKGVDNYYFPCEKCGRPVDASTGEWVAAYPGRAIRSYQLSQVYWNWAPARFLNIAHKLYEEYKKAVTPAQKEKFWRAKIGLPYAGMGQPLTEGLLKKLAGSHPIRPSFPGMSYMGVDNGNKFHWVAGHPEGYKLLAHDFGAVDDIEELDPIMRKHNVRYCLIDMKPNVHDAKKFALKHKKRVAVQNFHGEELKQKTTEKAGQMVEMINLPRTESLDELIDAVIGSVFILPGDTAPIIKEVRNHFKKLIKERVKDSEGREKFRYLRGVENHYGMAANNCYQAWRLFQPHINRSYGVFPVGGRIETTH